MRVFANQEVRRLSIKMTLVLFFLLVMTESILYRRTGEISLFLLLVFMLAICFLFFCIYRFFSIQDEVLNDACTKLQSFMNGESDVRIDCDEEGELYHLFHQINLLEATLISKVNKEGKEKQFLKDTISDISHQLKTPITALSIYNGILQDATEVEETHEFVQMSEHEIDRINTLVQNLLKLAKLDSGSIVLTKRKESVADMLQEVKMHFDFLAKQDEKEIKVEVLEDFFLTCDREWLMEALDNLVKNALDHTRQGDIVYIRAKHLGESMVQISVSDTGSGIHSEDLYHVFKRFYRSRFSTDKNGLGLGLALCKSIVEAHDGIIEVESEMGKGSTFYINLTEL